MVEASFFNAFHWSAPNQRAVLIFSRRMVSLQWGLFIYCFSNAVLAVLVEVLLYGFLGILLFGWAPEHHWRVQQAWLPRLGFGLLCLNSLPDQFAQLSARQSEVTHDGLPFRLTESDTPLLREPCPHTRWSGLQIHCKREGPREVRSAERIQRESSTLYVRSSPGRGVAAGYTGAKRASSLASALLRLYSTRRSSDK
jgi:hypothetical protein